MPSISSGGYAAASTLGPVALKPLIISLDMGSPPLVLLDESQASQIAGRKPSDPRHCLTNARGEGRAWLFP
jgi:hypothetical protein